MWGNPTVLTMLKKILRKINLLLIQKSKYWHNQNIFLRKPFLDPLTTNNEIYRDPWTLINFKFFYWICFYFLKCYECFSKINFSHRTYTNLHIKSEYMVLSISVQILKFLSISRILTKAILGKPGNFAIKICLFVLAL